MAGFTYSRKITTVLTLSILCFLFSSPLLTLVAKAVTPAAPVAVYTDGKISNGWSNWSWNSNLNFSDTTHAQSGSSIGFTPLPWGALYLHNDSGVDLNQYTQLRFSIQASQPGEKLQLMFFDGNNQIVPRMMQLSLFGGDPAVGGWTTYVIPLAEIHAVAPQIKGFAIQDAMGQFQPTLFVENIELVPTTLAPETTTTATKITTPAISPIPAYTDSLASGWSSWSWGSRVDFSSTNQPFTGTNDLAFTPTSPWGGLYLHTDKSVKTAGYTSVTFAARATQSGQKLAIMLFDDQNQPTHDPVPLEWYGGELTANAWKTYVIPLSAMNATNRSINGIGIFDLTGHPQPTIFFDTMQFSADETLLPVGASITPSPTQETTPSASSSSTPATTLTMSTTPGLSISAAIPPVQNQPFTSPLAAGTYTTGNGAIYKNGSPIVLQGVNWFGFETDTHVPHGLWSRNWKEMIAQMKSVGFNSVRIPVCPAVMQGATISPNDLGKNTDLLGMNSLQILDKVMGEFNNQHMYVLLDHHRPDCQAISELWYTGSYSESQWISDLKMLAGRYKNLEYFMGLDLKNEPHGKATWGSGNAATDWNKAAEKAGQAVLAENPNIVVFVEGIEGNQDPRTCSGDLGHWAGGNLEPAKCKPISTSSIPANKLVYSPHVYGPDVWNQPYFSDANFPSNMPAIWDAHFGFLRDQGYTIVPGEWGGKYGTNGGNQNDVTLQNALVTYLKNKHICSSYYWDWNPNSGDTGGVLQDDWTTVWSNKMNLITGYYASCSQ